MGSGRAQEAPRGLASRPQCPGQPANLLPQAGSLEGTPRGHLQDIAETRVSSLEKEVGILTVSLSCSYLCTPR